MLSVLQRSKVGQPTAGFGLSPLVIRFGRIGDMVMQAPLLKALHARFGRPCILVSARTWPQSLYEFSSDVCDIWTVSDRHTPVFLSAEHWRLARSLRRHTGPVYISEEVESQIARIRTLLARARVPRERCVYLSEVPTATIHQGDRLLELAQATPRALEAQAFPPVSDELDAVPRLNVLPEELSACRTWMEKRGWPSRKVIVLQPGSRHSTKWGKQRATAKSWPLERWCDLIARIGNDAPDATVLLCGSPDEGAFLEEIRSRAWPARVFIAAQDVAIRRLMSLLLLAHSMISVDTGPAHIAAAVGCPLVVVYGSESRARWSRRGLSPHSVVELGGPPTRRRADEVSVDEVFRAWHSLVHPIATSNET